MLSYGHREEILTTRMAQKLTKKQIEENLRNKLAHKYNEDREIQRKRYTDLWGKYQEKYKTCEDLIQENMQLRDKVEQYEDWIHRLQEFCNMPDGEREKAIAAFQAEQKAQHKYAEFVGNLEFYQRALGIMF